MTARAPSPLELVVDDEILLRAAFLTPPEDMYALVDRNRAYLGRFLPFATAEYGLEQAREFVLRSKDAWDGDSERGYTVHCLGELVGAIGLHGLSAPNRIATIGYWLSEDRQGRGIVTRSVRALIELAFAQYGLNQIGIRAATTNLPSRAIPERLGFVHTGHERQTLVNGHGELQDGEVYSLLRSEWQQLRRR